jgi:hypothetical protein
VERGASCALMYLVGNYRYGTNVVTPRGVLTPLAQKNYGNPPKPDQTQEFGAKTRGYVVLSRVIFRSKSLKISLRACWFKSGPGSVILVNTCQRIGKKNRANALLLFEFLRRLKWDFPSAPWTLSLRPRWATKRFLCRPSVTLST